MSYATIVGIDVSAATLDLCVRAPEATRAYTIPSTAAALEDFLRQEPSLYPPDCLVGLESTGDYHLGTARFFLAHGFPVKLLNPILTKQYTRTTIRGTKTDKTDAELIVKLLAEGHGNPLTPATIQPEPRAFLRLAGNLTHVATQLQLQRQSLHRKELPNAAALTQQLDHLVDQVRAVADAAVAQATQQPTPEEQYIDSIPGFATKLSAVVHAEIGDITRFPHAKSLVAYAGLDPRIIQSGQQLNTTGRITKRGSAYLRVALYLAANVARQHDPELHAYYAKKKSEGRAHTEVLCMIARKLIARIYTVLKERRTYVVKTV